MTTEALLVSMVRGLLLIISLYNCYWSLPWLLSLLRGTHWPVSLIKAAIFFISLGSFLLQCLHFSGSDTGMLSVWSLLPFVILLAGHAMLALAHHTGWVKLITDLPLVSRQSRFTVAMATLAECDPKAAEELRLIAIDKIAARMAGR